MEKEDARLEGRQGYEAPVTSHRGRRKTGYRLVQIREGSRRIRCMLRRLELSTFADLDGGISIHTSVLNVRTRTFPLESEVFGEMTTLMIPS